MEYVSQLNLGIAARLLLDLGPTESCLTQLEFIRIVALRTKAQNNFFKMLTCQSSSSGTYISLEDFED